MGAPMICPHCHFRILPGGRTMNCPKCQKPLTRIHPTTEGCGEIISPRRSEVVGG